MALRRRKITVYAVVDKDNVKNCLTYTSTVAEAHAYFQAWAQIKWADNFSTWCKWSENEDVNSESSWQKFYNSDYMQKEISRYYIYKLKVDVRSVASLMRVADLTTPLKLPFISSLEIAHYLNMTANLDGTVLAQIQDQLKAIDPSADLKIKPLETTNG